LLGSDQQLARTLARSAHRLYSVEDQVEHHLLKLDPIPYTEVFICGGVKVRISAGSTAFSGADVAM
jgi:hypothetical protein